MITALTCTDSDDAKSVRKTSVAACPCCGEYFEVPQLVEHVPRCKEVSRLKAEELWLKDGSPSSSVLGLISPPYSYCDCEEQCLYCLKMFAVSVLVEHACNCASHHEVRYFYENIP